MSRHNFWSLQFWMRISCFQVLRGFTEIIRMTSRGSLYNLFITFLWFWFLDKLKSSPARFIEFMLDVNHVAWKTRSQTKRFTKNNEITKKLHKKRPQEHGGTNKNPSFYHLSSFPKLAPSNKQDFPGELFFFVPQDLSDEIHPNISKAPCVQVIYL